MGRDEDIKMLGEIFPQVSLHHVLALWYREKGETDNVMDILMNLENMSSIGKAELFQSLDAFAIPSEESPAPVSALAPALAEPVPDFVVHSHAEPEKVNEEVPHVHIAEPEPAPVVHAPVPVIEEQKEEEPELVPVPARKLSLSADRNVHRLLTSFENQLATNFSEQERSLVPSEMSQAPKVLIIKDRSNESADRANVLVEMFLELGLERQDLRVISSSSDPEILELIKKEEKEDFPIVRLYNTHYFGYQEFVTEAEAGTISKIITESEFKSSGDFYGQTFLDVIADGTNSLFFNLAWFAALPITLPFSYFFGSKPLELKPGEIDFNVVHTNWYRRNLKQKMRFGKDQFFRMDADGYSILLAHAYTSIAFITVLSPSYFFITYTAEAGCSSDYLSASPSDCEEIIRLISTRCAALKHEIKIGRVSEQVEELKNAQASSSSSAASADDDAAAKVSAEVSA